MDFYAESNKIASNIPHGIRTDTSEPCLELSESHLSIDTIVEPFLTNPDLSQRLRTAQIVLLPATLQSNTGPISAFPKGTHQLYQFLQERLGESAVEAAIHDEDYVEAAFHSDTFTLPDLFVVAKDWLPIAIEAFHLFVELRAARRNNVLVESEIHYQDETGKHVSIKYKGPAESYERTLKQLYPDQGETDGGLEEACDDD